jgi:hypothetical protein
LRLLVEWRLNQIDTHLIGQAAVLHRLVEGKSAQALIESSPDLEHGLAAIRTTLEDRQSILR